MPRSRTANMRHEQVFVRTVELVTVGRVDLQPVIDSFERSYLSQLLEAAVTVGLKLAEPPTTVETPTPSRSGADSPE